MNDVINALTQFKASIQQAIQQIQVTAGPMDAAPDAGLGMDPGLGGMDGDLGTPADAMNGVIPGDMGDMSDELADVSLGDGADGERPKKEV